MKIQNLLFSLCSVAYTFQFDLTYVRATSPKKLTLNFLFTLRGFQFSFNNKIKFAHKLSHKFEYNSYFEYGKYFNGGFKSTEIHTLVLFHTLSLSH